MDIMTLLLAAIVVLILMVFVLLVFLVRKTKKHKFVIEQFEIEAVSSLEQVEKDMNNQKEKWLEKVKEDYQAKVEEYKEYVHSVERISANASEIRTHTLLTEIKEKLVSQKRIYPQEMRILSNVFIPYKTEEGNILPEKIDHIVLMQTGIYIIDTIELQGKIVYGMTKERTRGLSMISDTLFPAGEMETEKTMTIDSKDTGEVQMRPVDDPCKKVMHDVDLVNQMLQGQSSYLSITPILYFDPLANTVQNLSEKNFPYVFNDKEALMQFFTSQLEDGRNIHSETDLKRISNVIENTSLR